MNRSSETTDSCTDLPNDFDLEKYTRTPMTNWFSPKVFLVTGLLDWLARLFATFADRRLTIAALNPDEPAIDLGYRDGLWIDYVADLGDGWDSTYSVAWCLAQLELPVSGAGPLPRGDVLVMGGDQVYPYASAEMYEQKLARPYQAAPPCAPDNAHPTLFALPGNHDWYDGLRGFMRRFCQGGWLGGWKTVQRRPYWAVILPHGWWLLGVDSQMDDYIDQGQIEYFRKVGIAEGDRVVLCVAAPSWIFATNGEKELHRNLAFFEKEIITDAGATLVATISGDLHHFAHYTRIDDQEHLITCGGGGAFSHGTHKLPKKIDLPGGEDTRTYTRNDALVPSPQQSIWLLARNLAFPFRHVSFAGVLGGFYLVYAWVLAIGGLPGQLASIPLQAGNVLQAFAAYLNTSITQVWPALFLVLLLASGYGFAAPTWKSSPEVKRYRKMIGGTLHALLHVGLLIPLLWNLAHCPDINLPPFPPDWSSAVRFALTVFLTGAVVGGLLFGIYLIASNLLAGFHRTEAFSAARDKHNKCFLRMHVGASELVIYPIMLGRVTEKWKANPDGGENRSLIDPDGELVPEIIGDPIRIA